MDNDDNDEKEPSWKSNIPFQIPPPKYSKSDKPWIV
jgi:hypothetical protein